MALQKRCPRTTLATQISTTKTCSANSRKSKSLVKSKRRSRRNLRRSRRRPILKLTPCSVRQLFPLARFKRRKSQLLSKEAHNKPCTRRLMGLNSLIAALSLSHNSIRYTLLMIISQFMAHTTAKALFETMP